MSWRFWMRGITCYYAPDGSSADGGAAGDSNAGNTGDSGDAGDDGNTGDSRGGEKVYRTQAEFDKAFTDRLKRESAKLRKDIEAELRAEAEKANLSEVERLKAEKDEAAKAAADATVRANQRIIQAEARVQAIEAGVKPERVNYVLKLLDLSEIDVSDDGDVDADAIKAAIDQIVSDMPELVGSTDQKAGSDGFSGASGGSVTEAQVREWLADPAQMQAHYAEITAYYARKK